MFKIVAGMLVTSGLIGQFVIGPMLSSTSQPEIDNTMGWEKVSEPLKSAESGISDESTARYYRKLMQDYALDTPASGQEQPAPDFGKISRAATALPLQEAGEQFKDKELSSFYKELLKNAGWNTK